MGLSYDELIDGQAKEANNPSVPRTDSIVETEIGNTVGFVKYKWRKIFCFWIPGALGLMAVGTLTIVMGQILIPNLMANSLANTEFPDPYGLSVGYNAAVENGISFARISFTAMGSVSLVFGIIGLAVCLYFVFRDHLISKRRQERDSLKKN